MAQWADRDVVRAFHDRGIEAMWSHQLAAADLAHDGRHVVLSTGTASGKSLAYQLPILTALKANSRARALYLSPTKALGHDQLRAAIALTEAVPGLGDIAPSSYDGDSPGEVRRFARERSRWIFSNPDMIHLSLLRNHARWRCSCATSSSLSSTNAITTVGFSLECGMILRRLLRLCTRYTSAPTVIFASATTAQPAATASEAHRANGGEVTEDGSPQGARTVALWEPALREDIVVKTALRSGVRQAPRLPGDGRPHRRGCANTDLRAVAPWCRLTALGARARLEDIAPELAERVASYRAGYLAEDRRALERALAEGELRAWRPPTRWSWA